MTVVKLQNFAAEDFVYLYLKQYDLDTIRDFTLPNPHSVNEHRRYGASLGKILSGNIDTMYDSLSSACKDHRSVLFPYNGLPPYQGSQTNWFDLQSDNEFAINIKYAYDSSANSRIRDLTRSAVSALNEFLLKENVLNQHRHLSYDEIRNNRLHAISKQIKRNQSPTYNDIDLLYIKYTYLFCMNFIESKEIVNNIFFINFKKNGECNLFRTKFYNRSFSHKTFAENLDLRFSTNTKEDPHKQTVQYYLENKYIGFLELRSNKRAMLHLRHNQDHWKNLFSLVDKYYISAV